MAERRRSWLALLHQPQHHGGPETPHKPRQRQTGQTMADQIAARGYLSIDPQGQQTKHHHETEARQGNVKICYVECIFGIIYLTYIVGHKSCYITQYFHKQKTHNYYIANVNTSYIVNLLNTM